MPWSKVNLVDQKLNIIEAILLPEANVQAICAEHNISRKTAYKWLKRYRSDGLLGLSDKSRARINQPNKTQKRIEQSVLDLHHSYPYWGPRKLRHLAITKGLFTKEELPSVSTFGRILVRNNCEVIKSIKSKPASIRFERKTPNDLWQMDFKGSFMTDSSRCHPLTIIDDHSRYSIELHAYNDEKKESVKTSLIKRFKEFGLPRQINVDNGSPWGIPALKGITHLEVWLLKHGVRLSHSAPRHPQTNGKNERFHRTLKLEVLHERRYKNNREIQKAFDVFRHQYNYIRPHDSLDGEAPFVRYQISSRRYMTNGLGFEYPEGEIVRRVSDRSTIQFKGSSFFIGGGLKGEGVAIKETAEPGKFAIFFMDKLIKHITVSHA